MLAGTFTGTADTVATAMDHRASFFDWGSTPNNNQPSVYSHVLKDNATDTIYVSWNGAVTVAK